MSTIEVFIIAFFHALAYCAGTYILFGKKIRHIPSGILLFVLYLAGYRISGLPVSDSFYIYTNAIIITFVLIEGSLYQKIWIILKSVFIISCGIEIIEAFLNMVLSQYMNLSVTKERRFLLANIILITIWFIVGLIQKRKFNINGKYTHHIITATMGVMAIALLLTVISLRYAEEYVNSKRFSILSNVLIILSYSGIVILGLFIIYTRNANENYKQLLKTEYLLRHLQKSHYEIMLAKEEETRSFRHDISNHIMCLSEITKTGNLAEASRYIGQMQITLSEIQKKSYTTGNEILDAILNYNIHRLGEGVDIHVAGFCNGILDINNVELCSILSNPLQNAVEALIRQQQGRKYLNIHMHSTPNNFQLEIQNSFDLEDNIMINGLPYTKKPDNKNHGIGLKNVKKLVEKNNGLFQLDIQPGEFNVSIILPMKECIC